MTISRSVPAYLCALLLSFAMTAAAQSLPADSLYHLGARTTTATRQPLAWPDLRGKPQVVTMIYSNCHMMCPLIIEAAKHLDRQLTPAQRERLGVVLLSLDPERDTPAALAATARRHHAPADWQFLQPDLADVRALANLLGIQYRARDDGSINHTSLLVLLDAEGRIRARTEIESARPDPAFVTRVQALLDAGS